MTARNDYCCTVVLYCDRDIHRRASPEFVRESFNRVSSRELRESFFIVGRSSPNVHESIARASQSFSKGRDSFAIASRASRPSEVQMSRPTVDPSNLYKHYSPLSTPFSSPTSAKRELLLLLLLQLYSGNFAAASAAATDAASFPLLLLAAATIILHQFFLLRLHCGGSAAAAAAAAAATTPTGVHDSIMIPQLLSCNSFHCCCFAATSLQ